MDKEYHSDSLEFVRLGLDEDEAYCIFDFWNEEYVGTYRASFPYTVPPNACKVYRVSRVRKHPWLLSTDMHMHQGAAEIESLKWDQDALTLSGTATRPEGETGSLFFLLPRQFRLINHERANTMREVEDTQTVIRWPLQFTSDRQPFELRFEELGAQFVTRRGWLAYATEEEWLKYVAHHRSPGDTRLVE
jgi:hypothetical protein